MAISLAANSGYLQNTGSLVLYTCPAATLAWVKSIIVVNENTTTDRQFELYRDTGGAGGAMLISDVEEALVSKKHKDFTAGYALQAGHTIQGWSDVADEVNFNISVIEKTA